MGVSFIMKSIRRKNVNGKWCPRIDFWCGLILCKAGMSKMENLLILRSVLLVSRLIDKCHRGTNLWVSLIPFC